MTKISQPQKPEEESALTDAFSKTLHRRSFFRYAGATAAVSALLLTGCSDDDDEEPGVDPNNPHPNNPNAANAVNLGSGDTGILNYAYALEQLEAAFYTEVVAKSGGVLSTDEMMVMNDLMAHEVAHREFFKAALGSGAIPNLEVDFSSINFGNRDSVLGTAKVFEDLGVAAYNGAGKLISDAKYLVIAGKIVSVEARHAAVIRDLINPKSRDFAGDDVINSSGLDRALMPSEVLAAADRYIITNINPNNLPK
ncbi:MAG: ferritin-like domain-containing protein [Hymenobacteraceae bacterium]|nr:ferritin-like domain-containing protein [Hymenobacteraceae bacterium]MDX5397589.1 ferritin-like domain-containing protein [Hymenobacteraceae bacterium]MDX5443712.1 ferritin-like domain-containing protein [Hymenobacteraceae bacterium]MDX5513669.1 ferritin-like domain-containing protein [Hymenobacteraceae bacterium]